MLKHENGWERGHTFEYAGGPRINWQVPRSVYISKLVKLYYRNGVLRWKKKKTRAKGIV
jgi:hypothetical protein